MVSIPRVDLHNIVFREHDPTSPASRMLPAAELEEIQGRWLRFSEAAGHGVARAQIVGFTSDATNASGITKLRWNGAKTPITFRMAVDVESGDPEAVVAEVWSNVSHNADPDVYRAIPMARVRTSGRRIEFEASVPVRKIGNFRAVGRVATNGDEAQPNWKWMSEFGIQDLRFRACAVEHEGLNERIVHVGMANADPDAGSYSTFSDLMDDEFGKYNLASLVSQGVNAIRLQPPFRSDPWDRRHPWDTAGSPYAATDFFAIDPRYSRDARAIPGWDRDKQRDVANAEFKRFVDAAHARGIKVILDIALNHTGHNFTFRDLFETADGMKVYRNNFDEIAVNPEQLAVIEDRLKAIPNGYAEELFPEMFSSAKWDPNGAHSVFDAVGGGNGEWADTKELNHGGKSFGSAEFNSETNEHVTDWMTRVLAFWVEEMGVDGFRLDHATNMPLRFWERSLNQLQGRTEKPIAIVGEDFNQRDKIGPFMDAIEGGWYREIVEAVRTSNLDWLRQTLDNDYFCETLRTGNHDEHRIQNDFGGDLMAATRMACLLNLLGGWTTSLFGDEYGEGKKFEFKHAGAVPPTLLQARRFQLAPANIDMAAWIARSAAIRREEPALRTARREWLSPAAREGSILALARHADDGEDAVLVFANLHNAEDRTNTFFLDPVTRGRIVPDGWYRARDLMAKDKGKSVWPEAVRGRDLSSRGVYVKLTPYQIQALKLERVG